MRGKGGCLGDDDNNSDDDNDSFIHFLEPCELAPNELFCPPFFQNTCDEGQPLEQIFVLLSFETHAMKDTHSNR